MSKTAALTRMSRRTTTFLQLPRRGAVEALWFAALTLLCVSCCSSKNRARPQVLILNRSVAAWVDDIEITAAPNQAAQVLNDAGPHIMPELTYLLLESTSPRQQARAAYAMSGICYRHPDTKEVFDAVPALIRATHNSDADVRIYSVQALGASGKTAQSAAPDLIQATRDSDSGVRTSAVEALGRIGVGSPESVAALTAALSDTNSDVRITARKALDLVQRDHP